MRWREHEPPRSLRSLPPEGARSRLGRPGAPATLITLRDVTLRRGAKVVLERTSLTVHAGEKVGLVGRNGAGKSSLFALLANRLHADRGDVEVPPRWRVGEVAQSMPEASDGATEFVLQGDDVLMRAQAQLVEAETSGDGHAIA